MKHVIISLVATIIIVGFLFLTQIDRNKSLKQKDYMNKPNRIIKAIVVLLFSYLISSFTFGSMIEKAKLARDSMKDTYSQIEETKEVTENLVNEYKSTLNKAKEIGYSNSIDVANAQSVLITFLAKKELNNHIQNIGMSYLLMTSVINDLLLIMSFILFLALLLPINKAYIYAYDKIKNKEK